MAIHIHDVRDNQQHMHSFRSWGFRYGIALAFVAAALLLSLLLENYLPDGFLLFFLLAAMLSGWFGRTGAGLFAVVQSMVIVSFFFIPPHRALAVELDELPYFLSFLLSAVVTSWLGSARRSAEEKQKAHLDELFEQTPEAIMLVDVQDRVLRVNKKFTQMFGYTIDEIIHRPSIDLIVPEHLMQEALSERAHLAKGREVNVETLRKRKDGSKLDVSEMSFPVVADEVCIGYYVVFRDITEARRAREDVQKARAELARLSRITTMGELAASIAHEINQPIGAIVTNGSAAVRWLGQDPPSLDNVEDALQSIVRDANRSAEVIRRIRSLLAQNPITMSPLDMNDVIREVLALTAHETQMRDAAVTLKLSDRLPLISGDRIQLQQVLLNLIMNALDAMSGITDRPRRLTIKSSGSPDGILIQVIDCGSGWKDGDSTAIFDPFFTTKKDGLGMGLPISRSVIEAHGGRLWAEPGEPYGAVLNFTLPTPAEQE